MAETALITGASSGIGLELARIHASRGGNLVIVARRRERLDELAGELEKQFGIRSTVLAKDLSLPSAPEEIQREVETRNLEIDFLINNAGFGGHGLFHQRAWEKDRDMIQVNVLALTALTRLLLPGMIERGRGRIMNVASTAAFLPGPLQAVYYATKAYVVSFSEALANELRGTGVTVTALCPGATETEFAAEANLADTPAFKIGVVSAESVAKYGYEAMLKGKRLAVHGVANKLLVHGILRTLPRGLTARVSRFAMEKPA
jgi:short-subunit dehydrogenase